MFSKSDTVMGRMPRRALAMCGRYLLLSMLLTTLVGIDLWTDKSQALAASTVTIDKTIEYQAIDGFGGFGAKLPWFTSGPFTDAAFVNLLIDDLGLTILRDEVPPHFEQDPGVFSLTTPARDSCQGQSVPLGSHIPYLQAMKAKADATGQPLKFIASVWSPPAWMKYVKCVFGGDTNWNRLVVSEIPSAENPNDRKADYANFLVKYVQTIKQQTGIDVYAVSIQNEPAFGQSYPSAVYSPEVLANTLKVVAQAFDANNITTKIFMPEDVSDVSRTTGYVQWAAQDSQIRPQVDIMAVHGYGPDGITGSNSQAFWENMRNLAGQYNFPLWMTETSGYSNNWTGAMNVAGSIYTALKYGRLNGWVWWALSDPQASEFALMANGNPTPLYYASKQFYRYVRPGAVMVEANTSDPDVLVTAFKHAQQKTTTSVLINKSTSAKTINFTLTGSNYPAQYSIIRSSATENAVNAGTFASGGTLTLPANSITTLYGSAGVSDTAQAPTVRTQPQNKTVGEGYPVTFKVEAAGTPNLQYQWQRNGVDIAGATGPVYIHSTTAGENGAQYRVRISNAQSSVYSNTATLTVTNFTGANAVQATTAPVINGNASDAVWSSATSYPLPNVVGAPSNFSASFQSAWDSNNLYYLVKVNDPGYASSTDNVELYFDGNNTKVPDAYVKGDWQYIFTWGSSTVSQYKGGQSGNNVAGHSISGIQFSQVANSAGNGYQLEIKVPWSTLETTPTAGKIIGFDIDAAQSSTSGKVFWHNTTNDAWHDPATFGVLKLQGSGSSGGTGLKGEYFSNNALTGSPALTRTDAQVNFDWGNGSPGTGIGTDNFSVRWTGQVQATSTGNYTFATTSDDGVRLWVNNQLVIDNWTDHAPTTNTSSAIALTAGQKYDIKMEYYEKGGGAVAKLQWTTPGGSQQPIPQSALFPAP